MVVAIARREAQTRRQQDLHTDAEVERKVQASAPRGGHRCCKVRKAGASGQERADLRGASKGKPQARGAYADAVRSEARRGGRTARHERREGTAGHRQPEGGEEINGICENRARMLRRGC
jgi:hypothetical protein